MELSAEIQSSGLRKRKAEDDGGSTQSPLDSSGDLEYDDDDLMEEEGDGEASDVSSREEGQEWDVDSFDDGFDYRPKRNLDPNDEIGQKMHLYRSQMYRSKGFHVDRENYPGSVMYRPLVPIDLDKPFWNTGLTGRPFMQNMVDLALERYNRIKGSTVTREYIVRAIVSLASGVKSYITFMAREFPDGDLVEYQAKTEKRVWQRKPHVIFCRPAPKPKDPTDDDFVYTDSSSDEEDSDASSRGSGQEWDVDSFDDQPEYKLPRVNIPSDDEVQKMRLYRPQMYKSKGFNVDGECYSGRLQAVSTCKTW
ncbi:uncharacterized protein LOC17893467 [Capsella rubella]|uniref:uncharacterized protein LOC17893467 n=1 Tax=Capsella rubella TaxID=81985 RepID=UPI000CD573D5|nr:uncharacterized protein LOC17893467 [Capsella rubella]XP_023642408.1 uncharacterized protein LOC17893467 [Capsella rubella]